MSIRAGTCLGFVAVGLAAEFVYLMTGVPRSWPSSVPCTASEMAPVILPDDDGFGR